MNVVNYLGASLVAVTDCLETLGNDCFFQIIHDLICFYLFLHLLINLSQDLISEEIENQKNQILFDENAHNFSYKEHLVFNQVFGLAFDLSIL